MRNAPNLVGRLGNSVLGCLAVHICQENAGSVPRVVGFCAKMGGALGVGGDSDL